MIGLAALAYPIVILMITAKWSNAVIFLQIMCFSLMWYPIQTINLQLLQVKGKSELFFKLEIYKKILGVFIMAISIPFGLEVMCWGSVLTSILCLVINTYYTKKLIDVGFLKQMKIIAPSFLYAASMGLLIYVLIQFVHSLWIKMLTGIVAGASFYWIISVITNSQDYRYLVQVLKMNVLNRNSSHHS
jgi:O-antigen/teichoic acid export membrane protein